jgi:outer membrane protein assembly factor BamD (BamD/ComL family)
MGRKPTRAWKYIYLFLTSLISLLLFNCAMIKGLKPTVKESKLTEEAQEHLHHGQKLLSQKDYEGAIAEYEKVLSLSPHKPPEDQAFFNLALIYAHFGNPKRDYKKSIDLFLRILNEYPESHLVEQAKIWVGLLMESVESNKKIEKLNEIIQDMEKMNQAFQEPQKGKSSEAKLEEYRMGREQLNQGVKLLAQGNYEGAAGENQKILSFADPRSPKDEALFNLGLIYAHFGNPQRDVEKSIDFFNKLLKSYPKSPLVEQAKICIGILQENEELNRLIQKLKQVDIEVEEMKRKKIK